MSSTDPHDSHSRPHGREDGENPGYETSDFNWTKILWTLPISALILVAFTLITLFSFRGAKDRELQRKQSYGANTSQLQILHAHENEILSQYKWLDQEKGVARIPIERAMELVVAENASKGGRDYRPTSDAYNQGAAFAADSSVNTGMHPDSSTAGPAKPAGPAKL